MPGAKDVGVEFTTMSKGYNMAGWRVGFAAGNREMVDALATIKGYYDYGIFQAVQIAAIMALRHGEEGAPGAGGRVPGAPRRAGRRPAAGSAGSVETPKASMFVWAPIPEPWRSQMGSIDFAMKLLEEAKWRSAPAAASARPGEGYLRLALVENEHRLRQAVRQIGRCLRAEQAVR